MATDNKETIYLPLEGVESEHCALIVDKGLSRVKGVNDHHVELNNRRAAITVSEAMSVAESVKAIKDLGYAVTSVKRTFPVLQMTCASCAVSVESILKSTMGVVDASVNFATSGATVEYIPTLTDPFKLQKAVQSIGYDLMIEDEDSQQDSLEILQKEKYHRLQTRTILSVLLSIPIVVIGMFFEDISFANEIMWALATPVVVWLGKDFFVNAWKQAKHRSANMDTLVALSTGVAYLFSVFNVLFPAFWHARGLHAHVYFEAASVVIAFILLGKLLEEKAKGNTSSAIRKLMGLQPKTVTIINADGSQSQIPIQNVKVGDQLMVKPGERIPVDGLVTQGDSYVDESMLSGEPIPQLKKENEKVYAGTINQKGGLQFKAVKVGNETFLSHIIKAVQDAQGSKAPVQKLVDKIAGIFVPVVIVVAMIAALAWILFGGPNGTTQGLLALVTVLVIACPCALGLATPTAIMVGIGKGAEAGILIKDAQSLEVVKNVNAIVLDKTGTITEGKPQVTDVAWENNSEKGKEILAGLERYSEHPLAEAVVQRFANLSAVAVSDFKSITGKGVEGKVGAKTYYVGNRKWLSEMGILVSDTLARDAELWASQAKTVIWFADSKNAIAAIAIADKIKETSADAVRRIKEMGIELFMLTGDNESTARVISEKLEIQHYRGDLLPQDKADFIKQLQQSGLTVAMVGDGINDSTALAQADVGIAMGKGSDIAMEVAKMAIVSSDLNRIPRAIRLSRQTVATIKQNLFWAFVYNIVGIPIAAGLLYPINGFLLNPMIAGAAMALSSVSVVANSIRLKWKR